MASVASQLIEEVTAFVQRDSLEDAREVCADGTYFLNNVRTYIHTYICTYIHTYVCTYVRMHAHMYIHTHKHTRCDPKVLRRVVLKE